VPTTLTLRAIDTDNVSSVGYTEAAAEIRSGRVRIQNAYGSELAALPVPMRVEYYSTTDGWLTHAADTCTSVPATGLSLANNVLPSPVTPPTVKTIGTQTTSATVANSPFFLGSGDAGLSLSAPGQGGDGYVDITADLSAKPWLRFDWNGTGDVDPSGRATFGLYRGSPRHIYLRQRYN
jgi:MSHA biogenesis protein MshQ